MDAPSSDIPQPVYHWIEDVEDLERYQLGGYHPVHLDDEIKGRYRIVHKLGYGGYSTVWLARDQQEQRFVAIKFIIASASSASPEIRILRYMKSLNSSHPGREFVTTLIDDFELEGPNGVHRCIVTEVAGPSVGKVRYEIDEGKLPTQIARKVALQSAQGLAFIHSCGVAHGDFHSSNVLFNVPKSFHSWPVEKVYRYFGKPIKDSVQRADGEPITSAAPAYVVVPPDPLRLAKVILKANDCTIKITDFGESFLATDSTKPVLGTPISFAAPEVLFGDSASISPKTDIWALASLIYEVLGNHRLFESFFNDKDEVITEIVRTLGKMPDRWWRQWEKRDTIFEEDGTFKPNSGDCSGEPRTVDLKERLGDIRRNDEEGQKELGGDLEALEVVLGKMLRYEPEDRITIEEKCDPCVSPRVRSVMASLAHRLSRSFINTLFYVWTVIKALISLRSPDPFPFRETSAVVPNAVEIDLERGQAVSSVRDRGAYPMPAPPFPSPALIIPRNSIENGGDEFEASRALTVFSSSFRSSPSDPLLEHDSDFMDIDLLASVKKSTSLSSPVPEPQFPDGERSTNDSTFNDHSDDLTLDPFLDMKAVFPFGSFPSRKDNQAEESEPASFALPICTSTPPRRQRSVKGHKRVPLAIATNLAHQNRRGHSIERDSFCSSTEIESIFDTPTLQRRRSSSLRQSTYPNPFVPALPACTTPVKLGPFIVVQKSTPEFHLKPVTPLRIVKRNKSKDRSSMTSEASKAVITAVREAFQESWEQHTKEITGDPRELLARDSVFTVCETRPTLRSKWIRCVHQVVETEDRYAEDTEPKTPTTPPPPYARSESGPNATSEVYIDKKPHVIPRTELAYLTTVAAAASVDSCLDDILASFEHLMATMPDFKASVGQSQGTKTSAPSMPGMKGLSVGSLAKLGRGSGGPAQWSDILLHLDNY
ncbi:hypothetical protein H0H92_009778 [Tricholoma furcatifolium]|nr:hypothetical protein H0H92_009778 [Tricholoma furcatifolium]